MTDEVLARLILRSPNDPADKLMYEAQRKLINLGFRVEQADPTGVSFMGDRARFEEVFGAQLQPREETTLRTGDRELKRRYVEARTHINLPEELADVATTVVLPRPPLLLP